MFDKLNFKKEHLLIAGTILLCLLSYELAIKKTLEAWNLHSRLTRQIAQASDVHDEPGYLERKNKNLDSITRMFKVDTGLLRNNIITTVSQEADKAGVKLSGVPVADPAFASDKSIIQKLEFKGDFFSLLRLLDKLNAKSELGYIRTVSIKAPKPGINNVDPGRLQMQLYVEVAR